MTSSHIIDQNYDPSLQRELISSLEHCGMSQQDRKFYMLHPDVWDWNSPDNSQLNDGVKAILSTSTYNSPLWIESDQQQAMFRKLKIKYRAIERTERETEQFINDVDKACNDEDLFFLIFILQTDEIADSATESLTQAYDDQEIVCMNNRGDEEFCELITENL